MQIEIFLRRGGERETVGAYPMQPGIITIGRDAENTIRLADGRVSKTHAEIQFNGSEWTVTDLGLNGTLLAGQKLERGTPTPWNPGQTLKIIEYELELKPEVTRPTEPLVSEPDFDVTLYLLLEQSHLSLAPGKSATLKFKITNESEHVISRWAPRVSGLPRAWYTIQYEKWPEEGESNADNGQTARETLAPIDETTGIGVQQRSEQPYNQRIFHLTITVPAWESDLAATQANLAGTSWAGEREAILKIDQMGSAKTLAEARFSLAVLPVYKSLCDASPQKFRRGAPFGLTIINNSNVPDDYKIRWSDPENVLHFEPEKETVRVGIGEKFTQAPIIRSRHRYWFGKPQEHKLAVEVKRTNEENSAADLVFVNPAIIPRWAVILPIVALFVLLWMLRPIAELGVAAIGSTDTLPPLADELEESALAEVCLRESHRITAIILSISDVDVPMSYLRNSNCWYVKTDEKPSAVEMKAGNWLYSHAKIAIPILTYSSIPLEKDKGQIDYADPTAVPEAVPPKPRIQDFRIEPQSIVLGAANQEIEVCWEVQNAEMVTLNGRNLGIPKDCRNLSELNMGVPEERTEYTLLAEGPGGETSASKVLDIKTVRCDVTAPIANLRSGPGNNYNLIGQLTGGESFVAIARNPGHEGSTAGGAFWFKLHNRDGWIAQDLVRCTGDTSSLTVSETVGAPPPTATPTPTETPIPPTVAPTPTPKPRITLNSCTDPISPRSKCTITIQSDADILAQILVVRDSRSNEIIDLVDLRLGQRSIRLAHNASLALPLSNTEIRLSPGSYLLEFWFMQQGCGDDVEARCRAPIRNGTMPDGGASRQRINIEVRG